MAWNDLPEISTPGLADRTPEHNIKKNRSNAAEMQSIKQIANRRQPNGESPVHSRTYMPSTGRHTPPHFLNVISTRPAAGHRMPQLPDIWRAPSHTVHQHAAIKNKTPCRCKHPERSLLRSPSDDLALATCDRVLQPATWLACTSHQGFPPRTPTHTSTHTHPTQSKSTSFGPGSGAAYCAPECPDRREARTRENWVFL